MMIVMFVMALVLILNLFQKQLGLKITKLFLLIMNLVQRLQ